MIRLTEEMRTVLCPACGKELRIPVDLEEFSCVYCGNRMKKECPRAPEGAAGEALHEVKEHIMECIVGQRELRKEITREQYDPAFRVYKVKCAPIFRRLDDAFLAAGDNGGPLLDELVTDFLRQLEEYWAKEPSARKRKFAQEDDKLVIAIFLVPAIRLLKLPSGEAFCERLQAEWVRRYPRTPFLLGSYEDISDSFRKKWLGLCFITTAVCRQEGKSDDCSELTAFRSFRDGYLTACPDGPALIAEYYRVAPAIVTLIDICTDQDAVYGEIRSRWLAACYADLQAGRMQRCKDRYTDMVRTLEARYLQ
ncbi:MAG: CFI-box-CTERM domain-containing protein [Oscillospiraceae bacterium]|nr:CFI-box-CTERM domain-containing protein [Oscillospiraceae bacterium]